MIGDIRQLVAKYQAWLKENTSLRQLEGRVEITTPYTDRHNDLLQIYATKLGDKVELSDDGYIIEDLALCGCALDTPRRQEILKATLNGLGVKLDDGRLVVEATDLTFAYKKHCLVQAMLAVDDMFHLSTANVASVFADDVLAWLTKNEVRYSPRIGIVGKSGFSHHVDAAIPSSNSAPERLVEAVAKPSKESALSVVFKMNDIREAPRHFHALAVVNDTAGRISPSITEAFDAYEVGVIRWTEIDQHRQAFLA